MPVVFGLGRGEDDEEEEEGKDGMEEGMIMEEAEAAAAAAVGGTAAAVRLRCLEVGATINIDISCCVGFDWWMDVCQ